MKNKKLILVAATGFLAASLVGVGAFSKTNGLCVFAGECDHVGNHYLENDPDCTNPGNVEFWACCKCLQQFTSNPGGSWTDKGAYDGADLSTEHVAYVAPNSVHTFGDDGKCVRCDHTLKEELQLLDGEGALYDTPSTLGMGSPANVKDLGGNHIFSTFDFASHKTLDFAFNFNHIEDASGSYVYFYLGNQYDEDGLIVMFETNRTDGYTIGRYRTNNANEEGLTNDWYKHTTLIVRPSQSAMPEEGHLFRMIFSPVDPTVEKWNFQMLASSDGGATWVKPWADTEGADRFEGQDITFGANYFNGTHNVIRISNNGSSTVLTDPVLSSFSVTYKTDAGTTFGHLNLSKGAVIPAPRLEKAGVKFSGWYDQYGHVYTGTQVVGEESLTLTARFINVAANGYTLSDCSGDTFKANILGSGVLVTENEKAAILPNVSGRTRMDVYFYTKINQINADAFVIFGFPYDFVDGLTRGYLRLDGTTLNGRPTMQGYFYGRNIGLGDAGQDGTWFNTGLPNVIGGGFLVHSYIEASNATAGEYTLGFEVTFMGTGATFSHSRLATFNDTFSLSNVERTRIATVGVVNGCTATFECAW